MPAWRCASTGSTRRSRHVGGWPWRSRLHVRSSGPCHDRGALGDHHVVRKRRSVRQPVSEPYRLRGRVRSDTDRTLVLRTLPASTRSDREGRILAWPRAPADGTDPFEPMTFCMAGSTCETRTEDRKVPICRAFEAADGTRTHDLLHGKQTHIGRPQWLFPCKARASPDRGRAARLSGFVAFRRGSVNQSSTARAASRALRLRPKRCAIVLLGGDKPTTGPAGTSATSRCDQHLREQGPS
jgi:hypothetical protein